MAKDSEKIRLPELPVFKKYSLALRQEFASVDEILAVLDRTSTKIRDTVDRADEERRRQEASQAVVLEDVEGTAGEIDPELQLDFLEEIEEADHERPFWEEPGTEDPGDVLASAPDRAGARPPKLRPKPKKKARPAIVPVGDLGQPIDTAKQTAKKRGATQSRSKNPVANGSQRRRSTATSQPAKKKTKSPARPKASPRKRSGSRKR